MGTSGQDNFLSALHPLSSTAQSAAPFGKKALAQKALQITTPEFVEARIVPLFRSTLNGHGIS
jgi:hypothetical protein